MLCERCGKREATVNVVCVVNNTRVSKWLCETCAKEFATEEVLSGQNGEGARNILEEIFKPLRKLAEQNYYEEAVGQKNHFYTELAERILATARRTANQRQQEEISIGVLKQKAEAFLRATYQFNDYKVSYEGLSLQQM